VGGTYVRAVKGGIGFAKTPGNYAASLKAQVEAHDKAILRCCGWMVWNVSILKK
jgi:branched-subunit amino acid aminotransferase/4-amino-4-deoxychorismate lyase